jgi:hypothetical protein
VKLSISKGLCAALGKNEESAGKIPRKSKLALVERPVVDLPVR